MSEHQFKRRGFMFVLSSPSGAGKTSLALRLVKEEPDISLSVSVTTRAPRQGEIDGRDYYFVTKEKYDDMVGKDDFLEHASFCGNYYGTPKGKVLGELEQGKDILFDIEWQGHAQLKKMAKNDVVSVFIFPPSLQELEKRLVVRGRDAPDVIQGRMKTAQGEMSHWREYDYLLVNFSFEESLRMLRSILTAERLKSSRRSEVAAQCLGDGYQIPNSLF